MQLVAAYQPFLDEGRFGAQFHKKIEDNQGRVLYRRPTLKSTQVMSDWTAFQMRSMLNGVVLYGTGRNANWSDHQVILEEKQEQRLNTETLGLLVLSQGS